MFSATAVIKFAAAPSNHARLAASTYNQYTANMKPLSGGVDSTATIGSRHHAIPPGKIIHWRLRSLSTRVLETSRLKADNEPCRQAPHVACTNPKSSKLDAVARQRFRLRRFRARPPLGSRGTAVQLRLGDCSLLRERELGGAEVQGAGGMWNYYLRRIPYTIRFSLRGGGLRLQLDESLLPRLRW